MCPFRTLFAIVFGLCGMLYGVYAQEPANTIRDGKGNTYAVKKLPDNRLWTTDNLQIDIPGAYCYENAPENCRQYGRLYTWKAAQAVCPLLGEGWKLPSIDEWRQMMKWYGGVRGDSKDSGKTAFRALITGGASGFNIVFGGCRGAFDSSYTRQGAHGFYWTATETDADNAWMLNLGKNGQIANQHPNGEKPMAISVRCVKDIDVKTQ